MWGKNTKTDGYTGPSSSSSSSFGADAAVAAPAGKGKGKAKKITAFFQATKKEEEEEEEDRGGDDATAASPSSSPFFNKRQGAAPAAVATAAVRGEAAGVYGRSPYGTWISEIMLQQTRWAGGREGVSERKGVDMYRYVSL